MGIDNKELREQLVELLKGGSAHVELKSTLTDFPTDKRGAKPNGAPYNAWTRPRTSTPPSRGQTANASCAKSC
jgi:hypothetical protein